MKMQIIKNRNPRENFKLSELLYKDQFKKVERDHCIVKLLGLKDISLLHTQQNKMAFPIFHVFLLNLHMISEPNVSFQNRIQTGKFMNEITWQLHDIIKFMSIIPLRKLCIITKLQWPIYWNLKTCFIILALDSVEKVKKNRSILTAIIKSIKFCVRNGIAVCGHWEVGALNSNDISKESANLKSLINSRIKSW